MKPARYIGRALDRAPRPRLLWLFAACAVAWLPLALAWLLLVMVPR